MPRQESPPPSIAPKASTTSTTCRICYEDDTNETLTTPCECKGSVGFVHRTCLQKWLTESNTAHCELCQQVFRTEPSRIAFWFSSRRGFRSDVLLCTVITFIIIVLTYVCLFSHEYNHEELVMFPAARWAAFVLLVIIAVILVGYYMWVWTVVRWHSRVWLNQGRVEDLVHYVADVGDELDLGGQRRSEIALNLTESNDETEESDNKQ